MIDGSNGEELPDFIQRWEQIASGLTGEGVFSAPDLLPMRADMPVDVPDTVATAETSPNTICAAITECSTALDAYLTDFDRERIYVELGPRPPHVTQPEHTLVREVLFDAVGRSDTPTAEHCIAMLETLPDFTKSTAVDVQFARALLGDAEASNVIRNVLETEKAEAIKRSAYDSSRGFPSVLGSYTPRHDTLIDLCAKHGIPAADIWIEKYAMNPDDAWSKREKYLATRLRHVPEASEASEDLQAQYDNHVLHLTGMDPSFFAVNAYTVAKRVKDPEARVVFVDRLLEHFGGDPVPFSWYESAMAVGGMVFDDPLLATPERMRRVATIAKVHTEQQITRVDWKQAEGAHFLLRGPWLRRFYAGEPHKVVEAINKLHDDRLEEISGTHRREQRWATTAREERLAVCAEKYIEAGDFKGARTCIGAMQPFSERQTKAFFTCLKQVKTPADLAEFEMYELDMTPESGVAAMQEVAGLRVADEVEALIARSVEHAAALPNRVYNSPDNLAHILFVATAFEALGQIAADRQEEFARLITPALRQRGVAPHWVEPLSVALIAAGDTEEAGRAVAHIQQTEAPRDRHMQGLWNLTKALRAANIRPRS